jgi:hypothetical protein
VLGAALEGGEVAASLVMVTTRVVGVAATAAVSGADGAVVPLVTGPAGERTGVPADDDAGAAAVGAVRGAAGSGREVRTT